MNSRHDIPIGFNKDFLGWFKESTESAWRKLPLETLGWQKDTNWTSPLSDAQVDKIERAWNLRFPSDYRLFLKTLHTVDPQPKQHRYEFEEDSEIITKISFPNWLIDRETIAKQMKWPLEGLFFDLEKNSLWLKTWGPKPSALSEQKKRLEQIYAKAPKLVPIAWHRYLLAEPCQENNPVLSVYQADIINYGDSLRDFLLIEFSNELGLDSNTTYAEHAKKPIQDIPFWGLIARA